MARARKGRARQSAAEKVAPTPAVDDRRLAARARELARGLLLLAKALDDGQGDTVRSTWGGKEVTTVRAQLAEMVAAIEETPLIRRFTKDEEAERVAVTKGELLALCQAAQRAAARGSSSRLIRDALCAALVSVMPGSGDDHRGRVAERIVKELFKVPDGTRRAKPTANKIAVAATVLACRTSENAASESAKNRAGKQLVSQSSRGMSLRVFMQIIERATDGDPDFEK